MSLEPTVGWLKFRSVENLDNEQGALLGLLAHIKMSRVSEKLFFRSGFLFSTIEYPFKERATLKFPIQIGYLYPKGMIRPHLAYGMSIYSPFSASASLSLGAVFFPINEKMGINFTYDIDFNANGSFPLIPDDKLSDIGRLGFYWRMY